MSPQSYKWDAELYQKSSNYQYNLGLMAIDRLCPKEGEKILEIGSGHSMLTIEIAKKIPNGQVTAIEISKDQCEQALQNIKNTGVTNVEVICMDALKITYENMYDAVFSNSAIHWIPDLETIYHLIYNSLKPNGRIMIQTGLRHQSLIFDVLLKLAIKYKEDLHGFKQPWRFLKVRETQKILERNHFRNINIEPYEYSMDFNNEDELINYWRAAALVPFLTHLPDNKKEKFLEEFRMNYLKENIETPLQNKMMRVFIYAKK